MIKKQIKHGRSHPILRHASAVTTQAIFQDAQWILNAI